MKRLSAFLWRVLMRMLVCIAVHTKFARVSPHAATSIPQFVTKVQPNLFHEALRYPDVTGIRVVIIVERSERRDAESPGEVSTGRQGDRGKRRAQQGARARDIAMRDAVAS